MVSYIREEGFGKERMLLWFAAIGLAMVFAFGNVQNTVNAFVPGAAIETMDHAFLAAHQQTGETEPAFADPLWRWILRFIADQGAIMDELVRASSVLGLLFYFFAAVALRGYFRKSQNLYSDFSVVWIVCALMTAPAYGSAAPFAVMWMMLLAPAAASMKTPSLAGAFSVGLFSSLLLLSDFSAIWIVIALDVSLAIRQYRDKGPHSIFACIWILQALIAGATIFWMLSSPGNGASLYFSNWIQNARLFPLSWPSTIIDALALISAGLALGVILLQSPLSWLGWGVLLHCVSVLIYSAPTSDMTAYSLPVAAIAALAPEWMHTQKFFPHDLRIMILMLGSLAVFAISVYRLVAV